MISPFSLLCMKCEGLFGSERKPTTGNCGHTFCSKCVEVMENCARCEKEAAFSNCVVNYDLLKIVEDVKENVFQYFDYWHGQFGEDLDLDSGICDTCSAFCSKLRICKDCCLERGTLSDNNLEGDLHLVLAHGVTIHTVSKHFERYCGDCILEGRTLHTDHKTIPTSKISKYSIGMHQMSIIAFSYHVLRKTILEIVGDKCESVNLFFQELSRALVNLRIHWHCENSFRFYDGIWTDEKKLEADIKRIHEREERCEVIGRLRNILMGAGIPLSRIPAGIQEDDPAKLAELEQKLQKLRARRTSPPEMLRAPAAERNKDVILEILKRFVAPGKKVFEIASGTGQHIVHFASALPEVTFQPTECDARSLHSIVAHVDQFQLQNVRIPLFIDVAKRFDQWALPADFGPRMVDVIININMLHICSTAAVQGLFESADQLLHETNGVLLTYGPYSEDNFISPQSNIAFHTNLKAHNPEHGLKDVKYLERLANRFNLRLTEKIAVPANNFVLVFTR